MEEGRRGGTKKFDLNGIVLFNQVRIKGTVGVGVGKTTTKSEVVRITVSENTVDLQCNF